MDWRKTVTVKEVRLTYSGVGRLSKAQLGWGKGEYLALCNEASSTDFP